MRIAAPKPVLAALLLLIATHAVGLWQMIALSRTLEVQHWLPDSALVVVYSVLLILLVLILRGRYWARAIYTAFLILGILGALRFIAGLSALEGTLLLARIAALVLLYLPSSNAWFARRRARGTAETAAPDRTA